ncbi:MAG TPA: hypothetical protein VNY77_08015 [Candidatus Angelobacter sp.]|nr:hypothetical protein [Candidatus Angelobacter sp.]
MKVFVSEADADEAARAVSKATAIAIAAARGPKCRIERMINLR